MPSTSSTLKDSCHTLDVPETPSDKISAYYSLVFPNITYYLQTLSVTIGRRCLPINTSNATASSDQQQSQIDVDLGPLKSVSRLHAKIEWQEEEERFVLVVIGRNGAWVDGVWSGSGSKVALGERSQIQIASRMFHFVLPPPPQAQDDPSSPSTPSSGPTHVSASRARSLSVDITSLSPPTSEPTPPPPKTKDPPPSSKGAAAKLTRHTKSIPSISKKRKKSELRPTPPAVMPPKPGLTYAQLCYRAINSLGGKATLQDICGWMVDTYDWYRFNEGSAWENSVRHNLSSNRAFKKMERCAGERGKGFFWSVDANFEHTFEEQVSGGGKSQVTGKKKEKGGASLLDPPLKRSVKGEGVLPPPLTKTPLTMKGITSASIEDPSVTPKQSIPNATLASPHTTHTTYPHISPLSSATNASNIPVISQEQSKTSTTAVPLPTLPRIPFVVAPLPPSFKSSSVPSPPASGSSIASNHPNPHESLVLHEGTLYLHPVIFADLTPEHLNALEMLGMQKAIEVLKGHIVSYLREVGRREGRGRGRGRKRGAGVGVVVTGRVAEGAKGKKEQDNGGDGDVKEVPQQTLLDEKTECMPVALPVGDEGREPSPIVVVDDDEELRASKRRRVVDDAALSVSVEQKTDISMEDVCPTD